MFKIALIQNLSEMRNYSYADYRKKIRQMNFDCVCFTRDNITNLASSLNNFDCVIFASNSLNDSYVYEYLCREEFVSDFTKYLDNDGAAVVLHQNSLKDKANPYPFLGINPDSKIIGKYAGENVELKKANGLIDHFFKFPNKIDVDSIYRLCLNNKALSGCYWTLNELIDKDSWIPLVVDSLFNPIVVKSPNRKIILSSLLLDYQNHFNFFNNLLINLIVDNMSLAIVEADPNQSIGYNYFLNSLEIKKLYYKKYGVSEKDLNDLTENITLGVHSAILISADIKSLLPKKLLDFTNQYGIKLIEINDNDLNKNDSFVVHTVEKNICLDFSNIELRIQHELETGLISKSFLKTVEVLMKLVSFQKEGLTNAIYDKTKISKVFEVVSKHLNDNGSYDNTFGATCKMLWLFNEFLGRDDKLTKAAYNWIITQTNFSSVREKLQYHYIISITLDNQVEYLKENCKEDIIELIENNFDTISEYDFLTVMRVAVNINDEDMLYKLFEYINNHSNNGMLYDSYVTAIIASYLIEINNLIEDHKKKENIQALLFKMIIYLRNVRQNSKNLSLEEELEIICALYKFETVVSFPVNDLTELIFRTGNFPKIFKSYEASIDNFQKVRMEKEKAEKDNRAYEKEIKRLQIYRYSLFAAIILIVLAIYLLIYFLIIFDSQGINFIPLFFDKIKDSWPSLFAAVIIPVVSFIADRYLKKKDKK